MTMHNRSSFAFQSSLAVAAACSFGLVAPAMGQVINEDFKIVADDAATGDIFGVSVAIGAGVVVVGAHQDSDNGTDSGAVYVFDASTGAQLRKITPADGSGGDNFGWSVAIDDEGILAIGARGDGDNGFQSGSAYLFNALSGAQIFKLLPDDGDDRDDFGWSISITSGVVAVGARGDEDNGADSGSVYLFNASNGAQIAKILADDGAALDEFGTSVAIGEGVLAVGAVGNDANVFGGGSAYLFDVGTLVQLGRLVPDDPGAFDEFGSSIAVGSGMVAVGAQSDADNGLFSGSAYLFDISTRDQLHKVLPDDGILNSFFGYSISIDSGIVAVGAYLSPVDGLGQGAGSAYLFDAASGIQVAKLLPTDGLADDRFGNSISIKSGSVAVGSWFDDDAGVSSGSVYLFTSPPPICAADLASPFGGVLNLQDVFAYLALFNAQNPAADLAAPFGTLNLQDVFAYLGLFNAGCP
ncbi:MAG: hypothetical protein JKY96_06480 [Phycisphaerales bacterium]|nr:hypothetical protein [Phycisphaerales bacterium]